MLLAADGERSQRSAFDVQLDLHRRYQSDIDGACDQRVGRRAEAREWPTSLDRGLFFLATKKPRQLAG